MLNIKSNIDGGFIKYEKMNELMKAMKKNIGIVMENSLIDIPLIEHIFNGKGYTVGVKKPFILGEEKFSLVLYPKKNGFENLKKVANLKTGDYDTLKCLKGLKIVVLSDNPSLKTLLEGNGVNTEDIYYGIQNFESPIVNIGYLKKVDFREVGFFTMEEHDLFQLKNKILKGKESTAISLEEYQQVKPNFKDFSYEIKQMNIFVKTVKEEVQHLPFWQEVSEYVPSKAFWQVMNVTDGFNWKTKEDVSAAAYLFDVAIKNAMEQYTAANSEVFRIIIEQLKLVYEKQYTKYFLVVMEIYKIGRENNIEFGKGRGSVCGFLLAKVLGFIQIDAMEYNLVSDRFISKTRMDNVDIDIDVSQRDREKLIALIQKRFGYNSVAQVVTKSRLGFKNAKKEYSKHVISNPKRIKELELFKPEDFDNLEELLKLPEAKALYEKSVDVRNLLHVCYEMKDEVKSLAKHAAALIVSDCPVSDLVPVYEGENGILISQYTNDEKALEKAGLIKIDVLGLRNVDVISDVKKLILNTYANTPELLKNVEVELNDKNTLELYAAGKTVGVFQMESEFAQKSAIDMSISSFLDVVALNAMNRPGPKQFIPKYAEIKRDPSKRVRVKGLEVVDAITDETHGIIVYQEQINMIAVQYAGYSPSDAEMFRRAISKKNAEVIVLEKEIFVNRAVEKGRDRKQAEVIYEYILRFVDYGFNKSHSVGYGVMSFETAYYKANFPIEFMIVLLNSVISKRDKVALYVQEAVKMGIPVYGVDINKSGDKFLREGDGIRLPFQVISGVGNSFASDFVLKRGQQTFESYVEFKKFMQTNNISFAKLEEAIRLGAFDETDGEQAKTTLIADVRGVISVAKTTIAEDINYEMEIMGFVLNKNASNFYKVTEFVENNKHEYKFGVITKVIEEPDKFGKLMGKIELVKFNGYTDKLVVFSKEWASLQTQIIQGEIYLVKFENKNVLKEVRTV